jgi:hypothetical protein
MVSVRKLAVAFKFEDNVPCNTIVVSLTVLITIQGFFLTARQLKIFPVTVGCLWHSTCLWPNHSLI